MPQVERIGECKCTGFTDPSPKLILASLDLELEAEEESHSRGIDPPAFWPTKDAEIVMTDLVCSYGLELEPVLRGVTFSVKGGERIGICGRVRHRKGYRLLQMY